MEVDTLKSKSENPHKIGFVQGLVGERGPKSSSKIDLLDNDDRTEKGIRKNIYIKEEFIPVFEETQRISEAFNISFSEVLGIALDSFLHTRKPILKTKSENKLEQVSFYGRLRLYLYIDSDLESDKIPTHIDSAYHLYITAKKKHIIHLVRFAEPVPLLEMINYSANQTNNGGFPIDLSLPAILDLAEFSDYCIVESEFQKRFSGVKTGREIEVPVSVFHIFRDIIDRKSNRPNMDFIDV